MRVDSNRVRGREEGWRRWAVEEERRGRKMIVGEGRLLRSIHVTSLAERAGV
jgi:hypothetical protein